MRKTLLFAACFLLSSQTLAPLGPGGRSLTNAPIGSSSVSSLGPSAPVGGCGTAATDFLARTSGLNGAHTTAYTNTICALVANGTWCGTANYQFQAIYILATQDSTTAGLNLCGTNFSPLTVNGAPNFTADTGYLGVDGSTTVYLDTGLVPSSSLQLDSTHVSAWSLTNAASGPGLTGAIIGVESVSGAAVIFPRYNDGNSYFAVNVSQSLEEGTASSDSTGWWVATRPSSVLMQMYRNGTLWDFFPRNANSLYSAGTMPILSSRTTSGVIFNGGAYRIAIATIGQDISGQASSIYAILCNNWMTPIHGSC